MQGLLLVDKPKNWTSFDVVNYVRKMIAGLNSVKPMSIKVGHTGTLDPLATGLLVLLIGKQYTRKAQVLSLHDKSYDVTMRLGQVSSTGDEEGDKTDVSVDTPTYHQLESVVMSFLGTTMQTPPPFSAIKLNGQRAYKLARSGTEVRIEPRPIKIYSLKIQSYNYPIVQFNCSVGSGTYIRSLVQDIGTKLAVGAYMCDLRRISVGQFCLEDAIVPSLLEPNTVESRLLLTT